MNQIESNSQRIRRWLYSLAEFTIQVIVVVAMVFFIQGRTYRPVKIEGISMEPTFYEGDRTIIRTWNKHATVNDVIVFDASMASPYIDEGTYYVKRVIGTPGDAVRVVGGSLYVNDELVLQPYLQDNEAKNINASFERTTGTGTSDGIENWDLSILSDNPDWSYDHQNTYTVPKDHYFVLGDHRSHSEDSRAFGYVPFDSVIGVVTGQ